MVFKKVLVAYDNSDLAKKALENTMELVVENPETELDVVCVLELPATNIRMYDFSDLKDKMREDHQYIIEELKEKLKTIPNKTNAVLLEGHPSSVILDYVRENDSDLVVVGSRGKSGIRELLGSVSHAVVHKSPVPVMIMK